MNENELHWNEKWNDESFVNILFIHKYWNENWNENWNRPFRIWREDFGLKRGERGVCERGL